VSDTLPTEANFRRVLGRLPTGVVVVTGGDPAAPSGLVVGAFMSVSLDPPLVAVCPAKSSTSWPRLQSAGCFCANVLGERQSALVPVFSKPGADKFGGLEWTPAPATGAPLLAGVAAWIDCRIEETIEAGDHWLVLARVLALGRQGSGGALVFHGGALKSLP
jgi:3-hydroxy-9,10-secoandrosta-1,3,5(10)-triene-9,17-dione monooxygenase reductase component